MPQVSADVLVPLPPEVTAQVVRTMAGPGFGVGVRPLAHIRPLRPHWRFDREGSGTRVVLVLPYAVQPAWVRTLTHEVTSWVLRRRAVQRVEVVAAACRAAAAAGANAVEAPDEEKGR